MISSQVRRERWAVHVCFFSASIASPGRGLSNMFFSHWHRSCVNTYRRLLSSFVKFEGIISCCGTNCLLRAVGKQSINSKQQEHICLKKHAMMNLMKKIGKQKALQMSGHEGIRCAPMSGHKKTSGQREIDARWWTWNQVFWLDCNALSRHVLFPWRAT